MTSQPSPRPAPAELPVRTILTTIGLVLATLAALWILVEVLRVITWIVVAAFFAVALTPLVDRVQRRLVHRRSLATLLVVRDLWDNRRGRPKQAPTVSEQQRPADPDPRDAQLSAPL